MQVNEKQQGFVLISVLLITSISTIFALSSVGENKLQERIGGNQIKEANARSAAELGIFKGYSIIQGLQTDESDVATVLAAFSQENFAGDYELTAEAGINPATVVVTSKGTYHGAIADMKAELNLIDAEKKYAPDAVIVACEGISLTAGGMIDSFDSRDGAYSANSAKSNAEVVAVNGDVTISGGTNLKGNLSVNGDLTQSGSTTIGGNINTSGNATLAQATVHGNINVGMTGTIDGSHIGTAGNSTTGNVNIAGDLVVNYASTASGQLNYGGDFKRPNLGYDLSSFSGNVNSQTPTVASMASNKCNEKDIANAMPTVETSLINTNMNTPSSNNLALEFNEDFAEVFDDAATDKKDRITPIPLTSTLWEGEKSVYVFDEFNLNNTMVTVEGDVIIMIKGDMVTSGGGTGFKFNENDTNSSLTILTEGQVHIGSSTAVFVNAGIDKVDKKVPLSIYSSFDSSKVVGTGNGNDNGNGKKTVNSNAVLMEGAGNMYAKVYAPLGNIEYAAGGAMMGSLEGRNVVVSGDGDIHYDEALKYASDPIAKIDKELKFTSVRYHYPH